MTKFKSNRLLETAKILTTKVGQEIPDFFSYMADFVENTARILRGGISFGDNFACQVKTVTLTSGTAQVVLASQSVTGIIPLRVVSPSSGLDSFAWFYDTGGKLTVKATFTGSPTSALDVLLVLLF